WLATAGDWRAVVVQLAIIVFGVFFYLPFLKVAERVALKNSGIEN
ncbi:PTS sugar transporter subunit IIC, partial [Enterobacter hormaechei]